TKTLPNRPSAPVLTGILITAEAGGTVRLAVFDYEVSSRVEIAADVVSAGTVLVSGRLLADISKALPNQEVTLEQIDAKVDVTCGSSRFSLMTMPVAEYPALPQVPEDSGTVSAGAFQNTVWPFANSPGTRDARTSRPWPCCADAPCPMSRSRSAET